MKITRDGNGISWQDGNSAGSVGITSVVEVDEGRRALARRWVDYCAARAVADPHTVAEAIAWAGERWDLEPLAEDHEQVRRVYASLVESLCGDRLAHRPGEFSPEMSDEAFIRWHRETEARRAEAAALPPEVSGLRVRGFLLPVTDRNRPDMEAGIDQFVREMARHHGPVERPAPEPCYLVFEEASRNLHSSGVGSGVIARHIGEYLGVTAGDIEGRSPRFLGYILDGPGDLPGREAFLKDPDSYE